MSNLSYSQGIYPRKVVIGKDTVIAISVQQMKDINIAYLSLQECQDINSQYRAYLDSANTALSVQDTIIYNLQSKISLYKIAVTDRDTVIVRQQQQIASDKKEIKRLKVHKGILAIVDAILIGALAGILIL